MHMRIFNVLPLLLAGACGPAETETGTVPESSDTLEGKSYILQHAEGFQPVSGTDIGLHFMPKNRLNVSTACNPIDADYAIENDTLMLQSIETTEMQCSNELYQQELFLLDFLPSNPAISFFGSSLKLTGNGTTLSFMDESVVQGEIDVQKTHWRVSSLIDGSTINGIDIDRPPTLYFDESGRLDYYTGCSECSLIFSLNGQQMNLNAVDCNLQTCPNDSSQAVENHIIEVFGERTAEIRMEGMQLRITNGERGILAEPN